MLEALNLPSLAFAFVAAATGSLHCVGMCGPLRLIAGNEKQKRIAYQLGRGLAYALLGGAAGAVGWAVPLWALLLLVMVGLLFGLAGKKIARLQRWRASLLAVASASPALLGFSSGLLPCGMLHAWIAAAAATANPIWGALLLAALWLGTLPALELSGSLLGKPLSLARRKFPRLVPVSFVILALIPFLLRYQPAPANGSTPPPPACHGHH